jgi:uroporphyrinogen decarboxylase
LEEIIQNIFILILSSSRRNNMTGYELVKSAIEFTCPDRLPCEFGSMGTSDTQWVNWNQIGTGDNSKSETLDEWGCLWARTEQSNMGQIKGHPLQNWNMLDGFHWPDPNDPALFAGMEQRFEGTHGKYILTGIFMLLFERMHGLRGFENTLTDLYLERERIEMLADRIVDYDITMIGNISGRFPGAIHGFSFTDDWGTELATFVSPALWDEFFKPRYKRIFDAVRAAGWHIWMHSCGKVNGIMESLVDIGVNVLNLQQPRVLGIEQVGQQFAGRVCFSSTCDIQRTLPFKEAVEIEQEAKLLLDCWGTEKGGFILSEYGDGRAIGVDAEKKKIMFESFMQHDRWIKK